MAGVGSGALPLSASSRSRPTLATTASMSSRPRSSSQRMLGRISRPSASRKPTVSRWFEMASASTSPRSTCRPRSRIASASACHQSSGLCSNQPGTGVAIGTGARPSPTSPPSRSQAMALVAVVLLSMPRTSAMEGVRWPWIEERGGGTTPASPGDQLLRNGSASLSTCGLIASMHSLGLLYWPARSLPSSTGMTLFAISAQEGRSGSEPIALLMVH